MFKRKNKNQKNMSRFSIEQDIEDFQKGKIDEIDLKWSLQREYGSCSCMNHSIERSLREADYREPSDLSRQLESNKRRCRERDEEERMERGR